MSSPFALLEKQANAGALIRSGIKSLWNRGAWKTLGSAAAKGAGKAGIVGTMSRAAQPVAKVMGGRVGDALGLYGLAGMFGNMAGVNLPGSTLASHLGTPILSAMNAGANLITAGRAGSKGNRGKIEADVKAGADRAMRDYLSGLHIDPRIANDPNAYREFADQIGRGMKGADTYTAGGYKPMQGMPLLNNLLQNPNEVVRNKIRTSVQQRLPGIFKEAGIGAGVNATLKALGIAGATAGLGKAIFGKTTHDADAAQAEGYSAAQAAIQHRLQNLNGFERMMARMDPMLAANRVALRSPEALKQWEAQHGPLRRGMLSATVNAFQNPGSARFYSTDAAGNRNYIN